MTGATSRLSTRDIRRLGLQLGGYRTLYRKGHTAYEQAEFPTAPCQMDGIG